MDRLLRYEFRKILTSKILWVLFGIALLAPSISLVATHVGNVVHPEYADPIFADVALSSYGFNELTFYLAIFLPFFIGEDYRNGVIKNIVGRGYSKSQVYWAKWIVGTIASLIFITVGSMFVYVLAGALEGHWEIDKEFGTYFVWAFLGCICIIAFDLWMSFSFNLAVWAVLLCLLIPSLAPFILLFLIDLPIQAFAEEPLTVAATQFSWVLFGENALKNENGWWINLVTIFATLPTMPLLGWLTVRKRDIK